MNKHGVPLPYVAASLCDYTRKWIFSSSGEEDKMNHQREILEAVERLLPLASDIGKIDTFDELAEMSNAASLGIQRTLNGIYRAVHVYLDKHRNLTEMEQEEVAGQLQLWVTIIKEVQGSDERSTKQAAEENEAKLDVGEGKMRIQNAENEHKGDGA
ncbi:hypothetical protein ACFX19_040901 [Malus domestica]|uniref:NPH3 domain-containing protein n=1 Tax=Malus domestica TaxID=3750 RepID=A0A498JEB8_MALDO|nr:hypothetical protein DVH24_013743 [Malus domestica]